MRRLFFKIKNNKSAVFVTTVLVGSSLCLAFSSCSVEDLNPDSNGAPDDLSNGDDLPSRTPENLSGDETTQSASLPSLLEDINDPSVLQDRVKLAGVVASEDLDCQKIVPFYYEIGNRNTSLTGGSLGDSAPSKDTEMAIASASKLLFGVFAFIEKDGRLSNEEIKALNFTSGYSRFSFCGVTRTVGGCFDDKVRFDPQNEGYFAYSGGHLQKLASLDLELAAATSEMLAQKIGDALGIQLSFSMPQPAGGVATTPEEYAKFLQTILRSQKLKEEFLGQHRVCASPAFCPEAAKSTPIPENEKWDYSLGHWVEVDEKTGDNAFSSPGAFGFYPWIDSQKEFYGIVAPSRSSQSRFFDAVECGRKIRGAFLTGEY